jgi:hypothetical protein
MKKPMKKAPSMNGAWISGFPADGGIFFAIPVSVRIGKKNVRGRFKAAGV